jgi:hypothetical protein
MAHSRRVEVVEIPVEELVAVTAARPDRVAIESRRSAAWRRVTVAAAPPQQAAPSSSDPSRAVGDMGASFRRLIEVPGDRLPLALASWSHGARRDDRHLLLGGPRPVGNAWSLNGALRRTLISRWLPVELVLTPYAEHWTLLELVPRRAVHPSGLYFRAGHRSLDRFVAALRGVAQLGTHGGRGASPPPPPPRRRRRSTRLPVGPRRAPRWTPSCPAVAGRHRVPHVTSVRRADRGAVRQPAGTT